MAHITTTATPPSRKRITGAIVTADALHTVADHAHNHHRHGAHGLFPVEESRSALFAQLDAIAVRRAEEANSGRHEIRVVLVQPPRRGR
ncbi:hypothetical protein [Streptomyces phaeochromogenes]|uniref:hypothetical protein n=1 Tax=Streptomyces phaeochromogenes TaxID=1923 RepID=UPI0033FA2083